MSYCYIDFETRSRVPIKDGTDRYFSEDAEATLMTWAFDGGPVHIYDYLEPLGAAFPHEITQAVSDPTITFIAHNAPFDRAVAERLLLWGTSTSRWQCTRAQAYAHGLPGGLDGLGRALGLPTDQSKDQDGHRLIQLFCVPRKDGTYVDPYAEDTDWTEWQRFREYAKQDIVALRAIHRRLPTANYRGRNLEYFWLDAEINERGFAVDLPLIESAVQLLERTKRFSDESVADITGGAVTAITQRAKLLAYLERSGLTLPNLRKSEIESALQRDDLDPEQRLLLESRLEGARASGAKYKRAIKMHVGGRLRYTQQFSGAGRTGRTAHKGFQPGNMPRAVTYNPFARTLAEQHVPVSSEFIDDVLIPMLRARDWDPSMVCLYGGPNTVAANVLRHTIIVEPANELTAADYKNIESRILAWIADETWKLIAYAANDRGEGDDLYKLLYSRFFGADVATISDHERQSGKVIELACGFGGSVGAFVTMAVGYGMDLSTLPRLVLPNADAKLIAKAEKTWWRAYLEKKDYDLEPNVFIACHVLVQGYRIANANIDGFKKRIGRAVEGAVRERGRLFEVGRIKLWADDALLIVELPSGYRLCYWAPLVEVETIIDPEDGEEEQRVFLSFKRARGAMMIRERSWPGLTVENVVQAIANQLLRYGKLEVENVYPKTLILAVHDEAVSEARRGAIDLGVFKAALCKGWDWTRGLPLAADGWQNCRFGKRKGK